MDECARPVVAAEAFVGTCFQVRRQIFQRGHSEDAGDQKGASESDEMHDVLGELFSSVGMYTWLRNR